MSFRLAGVVQLEVPIPVLLSSTYYSNENGMVLFELVLARSGSVNVARNQLKIDLAECSCKEEINACIRMRSSAFHTIVEGTLKGAEERRVVESGIVCFLVPMRT